MAETCPPVNPGLERFWNGLIFLNKLSGGKPMDAKQEADRRGWSGAVNVQVDGAGGGTWHIDTTADKVTIGRGPAAAPRATIHLEPDALFQMLAGQATMFSLSLTGAMSVEGEGLANMSLWVTVSKLRELAKSRGLVAWFVRRWLRKVLALSGTGLALGGIE